MANRPTGFASDALAGRTALVTGAAHGIGQAIAEAYAASGADLALVDLDSERLQAVAETCRGRGSSVVTVTADVSDEAQVTGMYHRAVESLGAIDTLVANAGILSEVEVAEMSTETFDRMIAVNLRSVFLCDRVVLPAMLEARFGRIINTASQIGQRGAPGFAHYAAAKAGIIGFTKSLAREVSKSGVTANCIAPGPISTGIGGGTLSPEWSRQLQAGLALGRFGVSDEVSPTAVFLASSPGGDLYTGATLGPNSGDVMFS
jgi:3-oxoacyl-[acyl-carrier protein] reductase